MAWLACHASVAHAQPMTIGVSRDASVDSLYGAGEPLSSRLGAAVGRSRIYFTDPADRLRAVQKGARRAREPRSDRGVARGDGGRQPLARDPLGRLAVVRALAPYADRAEVRTFLMRGMMDAALVATRSGLAALVRDTAALALSRARVTSTR
ncbi:MAG: hypothetical protein IPM79_35805 [Polyangiaceae bacterium]|nr:hypothetical protein [Polyangiaceae bacterium]